MTFSYTEKQVPLKDFIGNILEKDLQRKIEYLNLKEHLNDESFMRK
jgi:hypothetical protein